MTSKWIVCVVAVGVIACGDDDGGSGPVSTNPQVYCQAYEDMCQYDELQDCHDRCDDVDVASESDCWFKACAVATGYCDNEVPGDPQILACADAQGWYDACGELETACEACSDTATLTMCAETIDSGNATDCLTLRRSLSNLAGDC